MKDMKEFWKVFSASFSYKKVKFNSTIHVALTSVLFLFAQSWRTVVVLTLVMPLTALLFYWCHTTNSLGESQAELGPLRKNGT